jgi:hypothetical protein
VPLGQGLDYYSALRRHEKSVKLFVYNDVAHSMDAPEAWDDAMIAPAAFFEDPSGLIEHDYFAAKEASLSFDRDLFERSDSRVDEDSGRHNMELWSEKMGYTWRKLDLLQL